MANKLLNNLIEIIENRPVNENLHYFICPFNNGYIINTLNHMKKFPETISVYNTLSKFKDLEPLAN